MAGPRQSCSPRVLGKAPWQGNHIEGINVGVNVGEMDKQKINRGERETERMKSCCLSCRSASCVLGVSPSRCQSSGCQSSGCHPSGCQSFWVSVLRVSSFRVSVLPGVSPLGASLSGCQSSECQSFLMPVLPDASPLVARCALQASTQVCLWHLVINVFLSGVDILCPGEGIIL